VRDLGQQLAVARGVLIITTAIIVVATGMLILTLAVVSLFAMFGELASRLPNESDQGGHATPIAGAPLGRPVEAWPDSLLALASSQRPVLLIVLSTACESCKSVADQLVQYQPREIPYSLAVIVSTGKQVRGEDFVRDHKLSLLAHYVDEGGQWTSGALGIDRSPSALTVRNGRLQEAYLFNNVDALLEELPSFEEEEPWQTRTQIVRTNW